MYVVREWDSQEGTTYKEFPTFDKAKQYFDEAVDSAIKYWKEDGMEDELIQEFLDDCVTETSVMDWDWEMEILVPWDEESQGPYPTPG